MGLARYRMMTPSPGSCLGGCGCPGEGMVPIGAALTTMMRRTPVVPHGLGDDLSAPGGDADVGLGPRTERGQHRVGARDRGLEGGRVNGGQRSAATARAGTGERFRGFRATAVTS